MDGWMDGGCYAYVSLTPWSRLCRSFRRSFDTFLYGRRLLVVVFVFDVTINARSLFITRILFPASYPFPISADLAKQAGRASKASLRAINYHRASDDQCSTGGRPCVFPRSFPGFKVRRMSPGCSSNRLPDERCVCLFTVLAFFRIRASRSTTTVAEYKSCLGTDFSADSSLVANISWVTSNFTVFLSFSLSLFFSPYCLSQLHVTVATKTYVR